MIKVSGTSRNIKNPADDSKAAQKNPVQSTVSTDGSKLECQVQVDSHVAVRLTNHSNVERRLISQPRILKLKEFRMP